MVCGASIVAAPMLVREIATQSLSPDRGSSARLESAAEKTQCPGCHRLVDVARPAGMPAEVLRSMRGGRQIVVITIGQVAVHGCQLCPDGEWR